MMRRLVIEKGQDNDGKIAAAICTESDPQSDDRVVSKTFYAPFALLRARVWAYTDFGRRLPEVDAYWML